MSFTYKNKALCADAVPLAEIATRFGTPCYVYSRTALQSALEEYRSALDGIDHQICYAVKANSSLAILQFFARSGAGFDIVSGGELARVLRSGADPSRVVFSGVGKTGAEIEAALEAGIGCFNVESESELLRIDRIAKANGCRAPISLRVNPDVDPKTHPYISTGLRDNKFGVPWDSARSLYRQAAACEGLELVGIDCHIGSQILDVGPFAEALDRLLELVDTLADDGIALRHLDVGGGVGIRYRDESPPAISEYVAALRPSLAGRSLKLLLEPGRRLVGNAGVLLTRVEYLKTGEAKNFAIIDAAMNDLMRPALYDAWHDVLPVAPMGAAQARRYDVVGPVCESGDFLARGRELAIAEGDLLAIMSAGAYGMTMSSNYNTRPRAAEVLVDGAQATLIRERETLDELMRGELLPD